MIKFLTCDISRRIYMSYGPRQRCPESRAAQPGPHSAAGTRAPARGRPTPRPDLFHFQAPSLSLPRSGTAAQAPSSGRRCQSVFHCQTFTRSDRPTPRLRRFHRFDIERNRQPSLLCSTPSRGRSWLTGGVGNGRCGWNINLIDCCQRSWRRRMSCSCPPESGRQLPGPLPDKPAAIRRF